MKNFVQFPACKNDLSQVVQLEITGIYLIGDDIIDLV